MGDDTTLKVELLQWMIRRRYIGSRYGDETDILSHYSGKERKRAKKVLRSMATSANIPVGHYKDKQNAYRILDIGGVKRHIERLGGDPEVDDQYDDLTIKQRG